MRTCLLVALVVPDPGRAMGWPLIGPWMRPEAAGGLPHQAPWTVHAPGSTLAGLIEISIRNLSIVLDLHSYTGQYK